MDIENLRPAETAAPPATAIAFLLCKALGVGDIDTVGYVAILVAFVPAVVTWSIELRRGK
jgi:hypothetical protein